MRATWSAISICVSQVLELGLPTVVALNMVDVAEDKGLALDLDRLRKQLPVPIVPVQANRGSGLAELKQRLAAAAETQAAARRPVRFPSRSAAKSRSCSQRADSNGHAALPRYLVERLLLDTSGYLAKAGLPGVDAAAADRSAARPARGWPTAGLPVPAVEAMARYQWAAKVLDGVVDAAGRAAASRSSDRIDRVLTHRVWGTLVFLLRDAADVSGGVLRRRRPAPTGAIDWLNGAGQRRRGAASCPKARCGRCSSRA